MEQRLGSDDRRRSDEAVIPKKIRFGTLPGEAKAWRT